MLPVMGSRVPHLVEMVDRLHELLSPGLAIGGILVASVAWAAEGYGFWLVVRNYAPKAGLLVATGYFAILTEWITAEPAPFDLEARLREMVSILGRGLSSASR